MNTPNPVNPKSATPRSAWKTSAYALVLLGSGFALGAASLAFAHGDMPGQFGGGWHHHGPRIGMIQHVVRGALENVGATTAQEDKIHDIIAATYTQLDKDGGAHDAMRKQILELMKAPSLDRAAFEKLRAEKVADMDAKSKTVTTALLDAAGQLSPEQRAKLVQHVEEHMARGGFGHAGWRQDGWHHDHDQNGHDGEHGPDHGDGPDHG